VDSVASIPLTYVTLVVSAAQGESAEGSRARGSPSRRHRAPLLAAAIAPPLQTQRRRPRRLWCKSLTQARGRAMHMQCGRTRRSARSNALRPLKTARFVRLAKLLRVARLKRIVGRSVS
jgi:hypothetical protein